MADDRSTELAGNLAAVRERINRACDLVDRDPAGITLVVVSKTWPASDLARVADLGVRDFGENRLPELQGKAADLVDRGLRWHFIGQIQSKKAAAIGRVAHAVHSVDRDKVVAPLARGAVEAGREVSAFVQVSLDGLDPVAGHGARGGADPQEVTTVGDAIAAAPGLRLAGVMTLPPPSVPPEVAFARLAQISEQLVAAHPGAGAISAGMSHDLEAAIAAGATHVRIGTSVFGERRKVG